MIIAQEKYQFFRKLLDDIHEARWSEDHQAALIANAMAGASMDTRLQELAMNLVSEVWPVKDE